MSPLEKINKVVGSSATVCNNTSKKVDKLISDATNFMNKFQNSFESNTVKANEAISNLDSSFKVEREKFQEVRTGIKTNHDVFKSSISSQISKLQDELAMEKPIIDNNKDEELDEDKVKRIKAREAELDEHQRIVREDKAKEKAEKEAQVTLEV
ncbi:unnamed protein product [Lactuca saligna]|uniref:Uncharacterized protein n=1 Tax=Lactuca saligna TaxID=75948 RepID=A0AA36EMB0_LACSI|nr:unnamed protein product [Lactuca saligna]